MQRLLILLFVTFAIAGSAAAQSDGWPGNCSRMDYPMYKTSTLAQYPPGYQPAHPNLGVCYPLDDDDPRLIGITYSVTGTSNFTCTQTAGDDNGKIYYQIDSTIAGNGTCVTHAVNKGGVFIGYPVNCAPIFKPYVTYAQNDQDFNRYYNLVQDNTNCNNGTCNIDSALPNDTTKCYQLANQYHQRQEQCTGKWGDSCVVTPPSGGGGGGCAFVPTGGGIGQVYGPLGGDCGTDDPIILDVEGEGFHLTSPDNGVKFDMEATQRPVQIAWTDPHYHNAFLVLDVNGNGMVDNGRELFGNFTPQRQSDHPNGFLALALYDLPANGGNNDGVIDAHDAVFSKLRLWIDANHDGISQPGELYTLDHFGIHSLAFGYVSSPKVDKFGNSFRYRALVNPLSEHQEDRDRRKHDGVVGRWAYDVFLSIK